MSFKDIFKKNFLENFTSAISMQSVVTTFILTIIFASCIYYVYYLTSNKTVYSKKFNIAMSLMCVVTSSIVLAMQANVVVSLGMVGALSIVRYRTAIKEPIDLLFLFLSISIGIILGAGIYFLALILLLTLTILLLLLDLVPNIKRPYILVVNMNSLGVNDKIIEIFKENKIKYDIKSQNVSSEKVDIIYLISGDGAKEILNKVIKTKDVISANLLIQDN